MSRSKRDNLKRKTAQTINHLSRVILGLVEIQGEFAEHHPDYATALEQLALGVDRIRTAVLAFALKAWGLEEEDLMSFI